MNKLKLSCQGTRGCFVLVRRVKVSFLADVCVFTVGSLNPEVAQSIVKLVKNDQNQLQDKSRIGLRSDDRKEEVECEVDHDE